MTPPSVLVDNRAFDVTPARLVTAVITDAGVVTRPSRARLRSLLAGTPALRHSGTLSAVPGPMVTGAG